MKKLLALSICCLMLVTISCQLTSRLSETPVVEITATEIQPSETPVPPTNTPKPTPIPPTKTPVPPTKTPKPTAIPTTKPLVIADKEFEADIKSSCSTDVLIKGYSNGVFSIGGGSISMRDGKIALWCYGAKHKWIGKIVYADYVFESDENDPMQFEIVKDVGYRFIGGVGSITYPDGKQVELYRPTETSIQPTEESSQSSQCEFDDGDNSVVTFESPFTTKGIKLDGKVSTKDEWEDAFCMDFQFYEWGDFQNGNKRYARWYVQHDDEFIYFLVLVKMEAGIKGVAVDYFWPVYTGTWAHSDGIYVNVKGEVQDLANWDESDWYDDGDLSPPGSVDGEAVVKEIDNFYWFEIIKPLNSGDAYDWALEPGDLIGSAPSDSFIFVTISDNSFYTRSLKMKLALP